MPVSVATLHRDSSGVSLTYRGSGVLPQISGRPQMSRVLSGITKVDTSSIHPVSGSKNLADINRKQAHQENLKIMSRLVNI
jgi:hypothetical protein